MKYDPIIKIELNKGLFAPRIVSSAVTTGCSMVVAIKFGMMKNTARAYCSAPATSNNTDNKDGRNTIIIVPSANKKNIINFHDIEM